MDKKRILFAIGRICFLLGAAAMAVFLAIKDSRVMTAGGIFLIIGGLITMFGGGDKK